MARYIVTLSSVNVSQATISRLQSNHGDMPNLETRTAIESSRHYAGAAKDGVIAA